ncbi:MAG: aminoglycoside 6-adenylyltransferase [Bacillota bacterium]|uniref:Aminoglycoside 6-adenylyltransferase n=1 Tax=Virgibacillus salarius TaxID=447199 RepID=A0A941I8R0_9BACI|nr:MULTISPECIES: aminoglycoside 6-adenylyltransferase [Bacillaceae]NAZ07438.1 aminoglycoside 6-adenylyltransferase [Agaribacter marinus]MBR7794718.1 aminoglycoside 6-adenylyltransferase [Virgibacillus salarius]MCC2249572.1 aminoglycoside 6-adenylyltransferase [Virgibacillus sp. AGTR]MDY7044516.1 aminoglycoside 6-adenylyltransferase [Virgibacillus sp. M23]QRZ19348.1 aminoglycoside 6-adenylyltransferase [Virgibacillus sp. AGTR]
MRSVDQIMNLVLAVAKADNRIRAVGMNGSRTNANAPVDPFMDYDIAFLVNDIQSFMKDTGWIDVFGERIIMQTPEDMKLFPPELGNRFSYLMLFTDGNRIDLTLVPIEEMEIYLNEDSLTKIVLDKDNRISELPFPTDQDYWVKPPTAAFFADCCNEFWWVTTYVAKGLWRCEMLYAMDHMNLVRSMLRKMLEWHVGIETNFKISVGKNGKYLKRYLQEDTWYQLLQTYPEGNNDSCWRALFVMCELFEKTSQLVANVYDFTYPRQEAQQVLEFLQHVKKLPNDATEI